MIRPPPRSTLFPSPTLSRSYRRRCVASPAALIPASTQAESSAGASPEAPAAPIIVRPSAEKRSEEHTSELQSRQYLVCRLLLEKKKNTQDQEHQRVGQT